MYCIFIKNLHLIYIKAGTECIIEQLSSKEIDEKVIRSINFQRINPSYISNLRKKYKNLILVLNSKANL